MAQISLTDLLGTDNIALSRTTINQNFQTTENAINTIENFLNTTPAGGELTIGSIEITLGANAVTDELFLNRGSGRFEGNLFVDQNLSVGNNLSISDVLSARSANITGGVTGDSLNIGTQGPVAINHQEGMFIDTQFVAIGQNTETTHIESTPGSEIHDVEVDGKRIIYFDHSQYTNQTNEADTIRLVGSPELGQRLFLRFIDAPSGAFFLSNDGFDAMYNSDFEFSGTIEEIRQKYIEVIYTSNGWVVVNQSPNFEVYY